MEKLGFALLLLLTAVVDGESYGQHQFTDFWPLNSVGSTSAQEQNTVPLGNSLGASKELPSKIAQPLASQYQEMPFRSKSDFPDLNIVKAILAQPETAIDLAQVEVAVERLIAPSVSEMSTLHQLDLLAAATKARFPQGDATNSEEKGLILLSTLRDVGPWNDNRPFSYDLDNPLGKEINDKLLSHFLATRKGNCVSMPVLFVVLGQKLGLPVTLSLAPMHEFAKFRKNDNTWTNIEMTSFGGKTDEHYQQELGISALAIANKIYLQPLGKKQAAVAILQTLMEYLHKKNEDEKELALTELLLKAYPKNPVILVYRADAFANLSDARYKKYGLRGVPADMRKDWAALENNNQLDFAKPREMGWEPETPEHQASYLKTVQQVRAKQGG